MTQLSFFQPAPWTVFELTHYLRDTLEGDPNLQDLWVQGEVSNLSRPGSGHLYFTLKDGSAALRCVMWRNAVKRQSFTPREGDAIEAHGSISIYEMGGQYQLYADVLRPAGEGMLYQEFLRLKARLEAEGLFDEARKRPVPRWPQVIGIVTSPTGAALRDMMNTLRRRYPLVEVILAATPVQGNEAPAGILNALKNIGEKVCPDVVLLARGGGAIEDLWAFNDERVARAIVACPCPVITGVGHETDYTIADFAADLRAPTPTAAAELATPDQEDLRAALGDYKRQIQYSVETYLSNFRWQFSNLESRFVRCSPGLRIRSDRQRVDELVHRTGLAFAHTLQLRAARLRGLEQRLEALNPTAILQRGYAVVTFTDGRSVRSVEQVERGDALNVHVGDGTFGVEVRNGKAKDSG